MLELPDLPLGRTTRYIQCISCEERFAITEEYKRGNFGRSAHRSPDGSGWHVVPEHHPHTHRREVLPFHQRRIHPEPVSTVQNREDPQVRDRHRHLVDINCPRCGADNRNWAQILEHPHSIKWFFGSTYGRVPLIFAIVVAILCLIGTGFLANSLSIQGALLGLLGSVIVMLAVLLPIWKLNQGWQTLLQQHREQRFLPSAKANGKGLHSSLGLIWLGLTVGVPMLLLIFLPREAAMNTFLIVLGIIIGLVCLFSIGFTSAHVNHMVASMDKHLPPPVYHSVANMTRLVIWEAQHALDANEFLGDVQWEHVSRLGNGGIELRGCLREQPHYDADGKRVDDRVSAHHYFIQSDRWARIAHSQVRMVRVPAALNTQQQVHVMHENPFRPRRGQQLPQNGQAPRPLPLAAD